MKARSEMSIVAVVLLCGVSSPVWSDQPPSKTDAEAFQKLRKIVSIRPYYFWDSSQQLPGETAFCSGFMRDLMVGKAIRVLEPYHRTESLDDPVFDRWKECGENPSINEGLYYYPATGTRGFRLYRVDADNNPRNGLEDVLYSEFDFKDGGGGPAGFHWWELKTCQSRGGGGGQQDDNRNKDGDGWLGDNYSLLIRYANKTWSLTMNSMGTPRMMSWSDPWVPPQNYSLKLYGLHRKPEEPRRTHYSCGWSTIDLSGTAHSANQAQQ